MRLNISHTTRYSYSERVRRITQSMRLIPTPHAGQRIESWKIKLPESTAGAQITDGAGNIVQTFSLENPPEIVEIGVEGVVETTDTSGVLQGHRESIHPLAYLQKNACNARGSCHLRTGDRGDEGSSGKCFGGHDPPVGKACLRRSNL